MAADAAVAFLLEQASAVIKGHPELLSGAEKEFENLKNEVEELKAILKDMGKLDEDMENEIRETIYEVEDNIDSLLTQAASRGQRRGRRGQSHDLISPEDQVRMMILKVKAMTSSCAQGATNLTGTAQIQQHAMERRPDPPIRQEKLVSLKDEEEKIIGHLMKEQTALDIIPIIGMPGLGKTALTSKIFKDEKICYEFPIRIWVHFSQRFDSKDVLVQIMEHFTSNSDDLYSRTNQELSSAVLACLSQCKFLLVVDDVWKTEHWDDIKNALPYSNWKGKVLITTREKHVGNHVQQITEPHLQRPLNTYESWELLQFLVFGRHGGCPPELEPIGHFIAAKCEGVPMTIVVLGGVLKDQYLGSKSDVLVNEKWIDVVRNVNLGLTDKKKIMLDIVALSYNRLPDRLRDCFLYLGVFPADYEIPAWTLMQLWIAEGFVQPDGDRSLEKIAEDNLNYLISRNLLMVQEMNPMRQVKVCRVYDVIRIFCTGEAEKRSLFKEVRMQEEDGAASDMEKMQRLCLHSDIDKFFSEDQMGPRVRSFLCFRKDAVELNPEYISAIPESFPSLRILESKSIKFNQFPQRVTKLDHLRYIVLCVADLMVLPEPLSQLWNLQTIIVHTDSDSLTMKANIWKMMRLRHVKTKAAIVLDSTWEGEAGENLQTLNRVSPESVTTAFSRKASCLKTLGIRGKLAPVFEGMPLGNMNHLEILKIYQDEAPEVRLQRFPDSNSFPPNLRRLTLSRTCLEWKHMSTIAMIHGLEVLKLKENAFTGISWEAQNHSSFGKLQVLHLLSLELVIWTASDSTFPCLRHLEIKNCEKLNAIPDGMLQTLESLDIGRVRKRIADSAKGLALHLELGADLIA